MRPLVLPLLLVAALLGLVGTADAQEAPPAAPGAAGVSADEAALVEQAEAEGSVRVLVALDGADADVEADGVLTAPEAQGIDVVQAEVLDDPVVADGADVLYRHETVPGLVLDAGPEALEALASDPNVVAITEDVAEDPTLSTSVPVSGAPGAWTEGFDGTGGNVAVLDSGVDGTHPTMVGAVVAEACFSTTSGTLTSTCPNGGPQQIGPGTAAPCTDTGCDHGTHVASTIAAGTAAGGPGNGVGAAPGAGIVAVKVFGDNSDGSTQAFISDQEAALDWLFQHKDALDLVAVNMSLGGGSFSDQATCDASNPVRRDLIGNLRDAGVPVAVSSGNDFTTSSMGRPGCFTTSISVGATSDVDVVASFSNNAPFLDLLAPGVDVCAPVQGGGDGCGQGLGSTFDNKSGTSMAAPHVASAFAVMAQQHPGSDTEAMLERLKDTGVPVTDTRPGALDNVVPRVQVDDALSPFADVAFDHPFIDDIGWMADEGVSEGFDDGTYRPGADVTRQAMSAFMFRLAGEPPFTAPGTATFPDVALDHPFFDEVEWMADEAITTGFGDGTFRPGAAVTRQAMSAFMFRLAGEPPFTAPGTATFPDVAVGHPFFDEVEWMADEAITTGFGDGTFRPGADVTRQAMSAFMRRLAEGPGVDV